MISVVRAIDTYIESVTEDREPDGKYHPSSMFLCDRQVIYGVRGVPHSNPVDFDSMRRFYVGHRLHEIVQRSLEAADGVLDFYPEFRVSDESLNIEGHGDGLVFLSDGSVVVLEVKSTKKYAAKYGLPKEEHKKQAQTYAVAVRELGCYVIGEAGEEFFIPPLGDRVVGVLMVYLEKEDLQVWEFFLGWEDAWSTSLREKFYELEAYREDPGSLPPRLPLKADGKKQWPCNYCSWKDKCWRTDPTEIEPAEVF